MRQWWKIVTSRGTVGRVHATETEIVAACGPWYVIDRGVVLIYSRPAN